MKAKQILAIIGVAILLGLGIYGFICDKRTGNAPASSNATVEEPESESEDAEDEQPGSDAVVEKTSRKPGVPPVLKHLEYEENTNLGYTCFFTKDTFNGEEAWKVDKEILEGFEKEPYLGDDEEPMILSTGHAVYLSPEMDEYFCYEEPQKYIISGFEPYAYTSDKDLYDTIDFLREEETGNVIYMFVNDEDMEKFCSEYESGQNILNGDADYDTGTVIVNGRLVPNAVFQKNEDGDIVLPMKTIALWYNRKSNYDAMSNLLAINTPNRGVALPNKTSSSFYLDLVEASNGVYTFTSSHADNWKDLFKLPENGETYMTLKDVSRILGWDIYYNDDIVSIITDETENNCNVVRLNYTHTVEILDENFD